MDLTCPRCKSVFNTQTAFMYHLSRSHKCGKYTCESCKHICPCALTLAIHKTTCGACALKDPQYGKYVSNSIYEYIIQQTELRLVGMFQCKISHTLDPGKPLSSITYVSPNLASIFVPNQNVIGDSMSAIFKTRIDTKSLSQIREDIIEEFSNVGYFNDDDDDGSTIDFTVTQDVMLPWDQAGSNSRDLNNVLTMATRISFVYDATNDLVTIIICDRNHCK